MKCRFNMMACTSSSSDRGLSLRKTFIQDAATTRARWLAEVADALARARLLLSEVEREASPIDMDDLRARLEGARREVCALRLKRGVGQFDPKRTDPPPWQRRA